MTMKKIELKTILGSVAFSWESENNTVKETVTKFLKENLGSTIKNINLSDMDLSGVDFDNSRFYNSSFDNSRFDNSRFYNSSFDNSRFDNSRFDNSRFDNSRFYNSRFYNSSIKNLKDSGALEPVRFDFFGRMLVLKNEVPFLKKALIAGEVNGSTYTSDCCCFMGTAAKAKQCKYTELPGIKPDAHSNTERWFFGIKKGDTPENSEIVKLTVEWIEEFEALLKA